MIVLLNNKGEVWSCDRSVLCLSCLKLQVSATLSCGLQLCRGYTCVLVERMRELLMEIDVFDAKFEQNTTKMLKCIVVHRKRRKNPHGKEPLPARCVQCGKVLTDAMSLGSSSCPQCGAGHTTGAPSKTCMSFTSLTMMSKPTARRFSEGIHNLTGAAAAASHQLKDILWPSSGG